MIKFELAHLAEYSDEAILEEIRRVASVLGSENPFMRDFDKLSKVRAATAMRRFGGWKNALKAAGLSPSNLRKRNITENELFENLLDVWTHYGRPPQYREMELSPSKIGSKRYKTRFGTWYKALAAFVEYANRDNAPSVTANEKKESAENQAKRPLGQDKNRRDIGLGLRFIILRRDLFRCGACGKSPSTNLGCTLHIDHIVPYSKGGRTVAENLRTLCADCNIGRGNRHLD